MNHLIVYFWLLISSCSCLINSSTETVPLDVRNLFQNLTLSPTHNVTNTTAENFAEGGSHNTNKVEIISSTPASLNHTSNTTGENFAEGGSHNSNKMEILTSTPASLNHASNSSIDLISLAAPSSTSGTKPRKGAHFKTIVARKGAPPCLEESNCKPLTAVPASNETVAPVYEPSTSETPVLPLLKATKATIEASTPSPTLLPKKPTITLVPSDSDALYTALKSERNVVIPIVALMCAPLLVLVGLLIYKRVRDSRGNSQYMRMGFLIEDIYND